MLCCTCNCDVTNIDIYFALEKKGEVVYEDPQQTTDQGTTESIPDSAKSECICELNTVFNANNDNDHARSYCACHKTQGERNTHKDAHKQHNANANVRTRDIVKQYLSAHPSAWHLTKQKLRSLQLQSQLSNIVMHTHPYTVHTHTHTTCCLLQYN